MQLGRFDGLRTLRLKPRKIQFRAERCGERLAPRNLTKRRLMASPLQALIGCARRCTPLIFDVFQLPTLFETSRYNLEAMFLIEALGILVALECEKAQTPI